MKAAVWTAIVAVGYAQGDGTGGGTGGGDGTGTGGGTGAGDGTPAPACASTEAGCSAYSVITSGSCATTAGCTAILDEAACHELHTLVDLAL